jgi:pimeloyl-ACP methyl ester carboxylesterase
MQTYRVTGGGGLTLHVQETGNPHGKPILFIHGFSQCRLAWNKHLHSDLAHDFRLVAMDIRGHGWSDKPREAYGDSQLWADDVHAVIRTLDLEQPLLSGWSYGGVIMADYVQAYGEDHIAGTHWVGAVSRLGEPLLQAGFIGADFLAAAPGFFSEHVEESVTALHKFIRLCVYEEPSPEDWYFFLGYNVSVPPYVRRGLFSRHLNHDVVIAQMRKPMWLSYGEQDAIVRLSMGQHIAQLAQHATLSVYPNVGHAPFWEAPERFNRELRAFRESV